MDNQTIKNAIDMPLSMGDIQKKRDLAVTDKEKNIQVKKRIMNDLRVYLMDKFHINNLLFTKDTEYLDQIREAICNYLKDSGELISENFIDEITEDMIVDITGLGPIEPFRVDNNINEIKVSKWDTIYIYTRDRGKVLSDVQFDSEEDLNFLIERIANYNNKMFNFASPRLKGSLPGKMRVHAVHSSISLNGPILNIRKFPKRLALKDLIASGTFSEKVAFFLTLITRTRETFVAGGPTGSGKTTLGMALFDYAPMDLSVISIEDTAEIILLQKDWRPLITREANSEGAGAVTIADLFGDCMRLTPDVIIVGEIRFPKDAYEALQAFHTGHKGSFITIHTKSAQNFPTRLANLIIDSGRDVSLYTAKQMIADAFDYVLFQEQELVNVKTGRTKQKLKTVAEITGFDEKTGEVQMENVFEWEDRGVDEKGNKLGGLKATGYIPKKIIEACPRYGITFTEEDFKKIYLSDDNDI